MHCIKTTMETKADFSAKDETGCADFWMSEPFDDGNAWVGRFSGSSPWERHLGGDEFLYIVDGDVEFTILKVNGQKSVKLGAGSFIVVPRGLWHRQITNGTVVQIGATPGQTENSDQPDPRATGG